MKKIEVNCGSKIINDDNKITYEGGLTAQGFCYVDINAFKIGEGICFISECGLEDFGTSDDLDRGGCDTRQSLLDMVYECYELNKHKKIDKKIAEIIAMDFLEWSASEGWCCSQTALYDWSEDFDYEEIVEYIKKNKVA